MFLLPRPSFHSKHMNRTTRGFTLIEVMMAAVILLCGLVAVASTFSFAIQTNVANRKMAVATSLLYDKMEEFRSAPFAGALWESPSGADTVIAGGQPYIRSWQITAATPRTVTVIVAIGQTELVRASTMISPSF
jgi:prepilin-type N-terminal cleavage/methylation domain-containing protein